MEKENTMSNLVSEYSLFGAPALPIWRDIVMDTSGTAFAGFTVVDFDVKIIYDPNAAEPQTVTVYTGRACKRPGASYIDVQLNDILAGFLRGEPWLLADTFDVPGMNTFGVASGGLCKLGTERAATILKAAITWKDPDGVTESETEYVTVMNDWNYERDLHGDSINGGTFLTCPVMDTHKTGQHLLIGMRRCRCLELYRMEPVPNSPGSYYARLVWHAIPGEGLDPGLDPLGSGPAFAVVPGYFSEGTYVFLARYTDGEGYGRSYETDFFYMKPSGCDRYVLHYLNTYGGWDSIPVEGKIVETSELDRKTYERGGRTTTRDTANTSQLLRQKTVLASDETRHLELHTGWMTAGQAQRIRQVLNSVDVWLERIDGLVSDNLFGSADGRFLPGVLTGKSFEEKAYEGYNWNTGAVSRGGANKVDPGKLIQYQIDIDIAVTYRRQ